MFKFGRHDLIINLREIDVYILKVGKKIKKNLFVFNLFWLLHLPEKIYIYISYLIKFSEDRWLSPTQLWI